VNGQRSGAFRANRARNDKTPAPPEPRLGSSPAGTEAQMPRVLVLYYSSYGHIEAMAYAVAAGAAEAGASVRVMRVPETVPEAVARGAGFKVDQEAPVARVADLEDYDALVVGVGTRFGRMASQMSAFLDQAGELWARSALRGKVGGAFTSSATQHGGQEATLLAIIVNLLHFGMTIVGLDYGFAGQKTLDEVSGGSPYGATTVAGGNGARHPTENELAGARYQGRRIAEIAARLSRDPAGPCPRQSRSDRPSCGNPGKARSRRPG
jgi:NAD(P)H dehydrogenase (quinone)